MDTKFRSLRQSLASFLALTLALTLIMAHSAIAQDVFISSRSNDKVIQFDGATGQYIRDFVPAGAGGIDAPQEVVFHPDGSMLVISRWNSTIKQWDTNNGSYMGNWSSGFSLSEPTKTVIGPDSLLYVAQWHAVNNNIIRFDLNTGQFIDEFTNVGVSQGCGITWDPLGNMYVATWGGGNNGRVYKYDTAGVYQGIFINTGDITGPTNIWMDGWDMFVADWSQGKVVQFDSSANLVKTLVTGMTNVEGFAFDAMGRLLLGDWGANRVYRYDFVQDTFGIWFAGGGMSQPNGIAIGHATVVGVAEGIGEELAISHLPNPVRYAVRFEVEMPQSGHVYLELKDLAGRHVATIHDGELQAGRRYISWNAAHLPVGLYTYSLRTADEVRTGKLLRTN